MGGILVPMGSAVARGLVFGRAWDRFVLAWPFARVAVVLGAPVAASDLADAIRAANGVAAEVLDNATESAKLAEAPAGGLNEPAGGQVQ